MAGTVSTATRSHLRDQPIGQTEPTFTVSQHQSDLLFQLPVCSLISIIRILSTHDTDRAARQTHHPSNLARREAQKCKKSEFSLLKVLCMHRH